MAITLDFVWRGIKIPAAYIRLDHISGGKRENRITPDQEGEGIWHSTVGVYADDKQPVPVLVLDITVPFVAEESPFVPLYAALKEKPEFAKAVDC